MLRAYAETIKLKDAEIERLKALVKDRMYELEEINELKSLLARAVEALEEFHGPYYVIENCDCAVCKLTRELRKAAE
jgi:hypothetical protein